MKKIIMSAMVLAMMTGLANNASAQKGLSVSVKATPQFSFLQNSDDKDNSQLDRKATINTNFGIGAGYNFTDNYGVGVDVLYSLQGQKYETAGVESTQKLEYVKVPVYFSYNANPLKTVSFYGKIGPQVSFLTNAKLTGDKASETVGGNKDKYESVTFGGMANAGVQFKLTDKFYLQTGLNFDYDFSNAEDKSFTGHLDNRSATNNMTAGVQVGLKYQF